MTNEQLNYLIDGFLRPEAEKLRAMKARLESELAALPQYTEFTETGDVVQLLRPDAAQLPSITQNDLRAFVYALGTIQGAMANVPASLLAKFCVRNIEVQ